MIDGRQKLAGRIALIVPEHNACEAVIENIPTLDGQGLSVFIGDESLLRGVVKIGDRGGGVPIARKAGLEDRAVKETIRGTPLRRRLAGLEEAMVHFGNMVPRAAIEGNAQQDFCSGN